MTRYLKYIGLCSIILFGLYYTELMSDIVINNSDLMLQINDTKDEYNIKPVNATINDKYIVPGINGMNVNVLKSYNNMKGLDIFNSYYLIYDETSPEISLENNKNKIISNGNINKNAISIIIKNNEEVISYSLAKSLPITRLVNYNTYSNNSKYEQINNDFDNYKDVEKLLNRHNQNKNICIVDKDNKNLCKKNHKYLVEYNVTLNKSNIAIIKNSLSSGDIIYIDDNTPIEDYKFLLRQIYYQDLKIISLSELISEKRN